MLKRASTRARPAAPNAIRFSGSHASSTSASANARASPRWNQAAGRAVFNLLGSPTVIRGHNRQSGGHRFERRVGAAGRLRNHGEEIKLLQESLNVLKFAAPFDAQAGAEFIEPLSILARVGFRAAGDAQHVRRQAGSREAQRFDQLVEFLLRRDARRRADDE